jgi:serine/threonine-protein kinase
MSEAQSLTQLGRYQIVRVLGQGGMGLVYEALDPRLGRHVAIKTILTSQLFDRTAAADYSARFVREAQAAARLNHPNIVTVFDFGEEGDIAYLVMEFVRGRELRNFFDDGAFFDLPDAMRIMCELLDALGYAHDRGIIHRDVKPANVMIDGAGHVKLTDFGVARIAEGNQDRTLAGTMVGTPSYMSPEQVQGLPVGSRSDLFAAGIILYQFLTHQKPFAGAGHWTIQKKIVHDDPDPPSSLDPAVPAVFDAIVSRALAKDPAHRYPSAAAFAADLKQALARAPIRQGDISPGALVPPVLGDAARTLPGEATEVATGTAALATRADDATLRMEQSTVTGWTGDASRRTRDAVATERYPAEVPDWAPPPQAGDRTHEPAAPRRGNRLWMIGGTVAIVATAILVSYRSLERPASDPATAAPAGSPPAAAPALVPAPRAGAAAVGDAAARPAGAPDSGPAAAKPSEPVARTATAPRAPSETATERDGRAAREASVAATRQETRRPGTPQTKAATNTARFVAPLEIDINSRVREPARQARATETPGVRDSRCSDFVQRLQLGDVLSDSENAIFAKECKR